ncbi:BREX system P-loop protein BrxC [Chloroflexota bacterium]
MQIKKLFDSSKDIYRTIEKVITYSASQEARLKAEITEYIATNNIEEQFEKLLSKMQAAMEAGGQNEVGVWVSGFYGSGKSSFTKYLGLALDESVTIDGARFLKYLQDRMNKPQTKALLATLASKFPAAVVLLDLASDMVAGATMEEVSTVLYYKVLQWAGFSRNLKVAALERRLQKDGRYEDFTNRIRSELGVAWTEIQNDPLVIDSLIPEIAHDMYPALFKTSTSFNTETVDFVRFENERVQEMIEIVRMKSGKENIIFIIDEVGQYVGSRPNLILNLDGLSKNLKNIGNGKVWIIGTAQQTLTEDDPRASLNSPELYKLKDRFPIQIDLESRDIKEICYRRLLGKSAEGNKKLGSLFDKHGQELRYNTKLQDAKYYEADFDKTNFVNLYPFLPAHFDILLHLLGALAKSTGGVGLRSAIKVIQDVLIEGANGQTPVADQNVGWLATTVTLYDALEKDIRRAQPSIHKAVEKALQHFDSPIHQEVAKTVAVLQILANMPVTVQNVASLTHPSLDAASRLDDIKAAVEDLKSDGFVPFGEKEGNLCFFSEKINNIDQERAQIGLRSIEGRRIQNAALREAFDPLPSTRLNGTLSITAGLKSNISGMVSGLAGDKETIQMEVSFVPAEDYETARTRLVDESRQRSSQYVIYVVGRTVREIQEHVSEIYRSEEIVTRYRNDPDQEVKEYCNGQTDRAKTLALELQRVLANCLSQGSFIFRGQITAVSSLDQDLNEAAKKLLANVAEEVFDRYNEAPVRADTTLAEKFLKTTNLKAITSEIDPLGLVQVVSGTPRINTSHKALISVRDYLNQAGAAEGKRLTDHFSAAPFGWSPDTLRYLIAALLVNGEIILKISGREVKVNGQQALESLRTNVSFKTVGVSLRAGQLSPDLLAKAAERLTDLVGETVVPLEQEISKLAVKNFPKFQQQYGPLEEKLRNLGLPGVDAIQDLNKDLKDVLETDGSDAPQRLGGADSTLYENLKWAAQVYTALNNGLEVTVRNLREHWREIKPLPDTGTPGALRSNVEDALNQINDRLGQNNFYAHTADLNSTLTQIKSLVQKAVTQLSDEQQEKIRAAQKEMQELSDWQELTREEQNNQLAEIEKLVLSEVSGDLNGLKRLLGQDYLINNQVEAYKRNIKEEGTRRRAERMKEGKPGEKIKRTVRMPVRVTTSTQLGELIQQLQALKDELALRPDIEITLEFED